MHFWCAHDLFNKLVFEGLDDIFGLLLGFLGALRTLRLRFGLSLLAFFFFNTTLFEDCVRKGCRVFIKHDIDHELMALASVGELDHFGGLCVVVRSIIIVISNLLGRVDKLAKVDSGCTGLFLDEINQLLKVVLKISA